MAYKDKIKNWYEIAGQAGTGITRKNDKNFKNHYIKPCQMISIIGSTGCGKSQTILEYLHRRNNVFYKILLFSGSTVDEPLYNLLKSKIDGVEMIDDADNLPELKDMNEEEKTHEKLIIFDDIINLPKKQLIKIQKWFNSSRKYGYSCLCTAQSFTDLPIQIRRNTMIFILFRLNDMGTINHIIRSHAGEYDKDAIKRAYFDATSQPHNFFMLDCNSHDATKFRHNFLDFITIPKN